MGIFLMRLVGRLELKGLMIMIMGDSGWDWMTRILWGEAGFGDVLG